MSVFQAVNTALAPEPYSRNSEATTPTTPRPSTAPVLPPPPPPNRMDDATTPTRATFGTLATQRPLPAEPFSSAVSVPDRPALDKKQPSRVDSQRSTKSKDSEDVDMDESDEDEDDEGSDADSVNADGTINKKKKSQRFWCTEYPPCNLSFTRSEHLARHIRKHTGERPFQCHCSRRFSRLDNLRQHAQTVHVNEDIPGDSLAATGARFQRQVRMERVRPPSNRSRANTGGSSTSQGRGHHRNSLSASSVSSVGSTYSPREDVRRRPPPLVMAGDPRARLSLEHYGPEYRGPEYRPISPGGVNTPTSASFLTGQGSPRWGSGTQSPVSSHSRTASLYAGHRTPGRRLSFPTGANPFQSPTGYGPVLLTPMNAPNQGYTSPSGSVLASPTTSTAGSMWSRRDSVSSAADEAWRRRTWHPDSYSNFTSRLINVTTPSYYQDPAPPAPPQTTRLPGIESFDPLRRPQTPPLRTASPVMVDTPSRGPLIHHHAQSTHGQRQPSIDSGLQRNMTRLDLARTESASHWANEANRAVEAQAEHMRAAGPTVRFEQPYTAREHRHAQHYSAPPITPRESKRQGWYNGPPLAHHELQSQRTSPEDSTSSSEGIPGTPGSANVNEYHPSIIHASGWVEGHRQPTMQTYSNYGPPVMDQNYIYPSGPRMAENSQQHAASKSDGMLRLEALVAVATSEDKAATAY